MAGVPNEKRDESGESRSDVRDVGEMRVMMMEVVDMAEVNMVEDNGGGVGRSNVAVGNGRARDARWS
ncbi:hypothetical protein LR48_Vigan07g237800 [Vigna angularis]|uniref:Uncharacterized protein n=1 Tax=Phaseolus angularis TaxID=3914 RepID=A0A0L9V1P1_PHAAN|nr:hypothetical protein LR48_Vigan07g237800 [Vigna angularis]